MHKTLMLYLCFSFLLILPFDMLAEKTLYPLDRDTLITVINTDNLAYSNISITDVSNLTLLAISPSERYLSWRAKWLKPDTCVCEDKGWPPNVLIVMDLQTGITDTICHVMNYDWSPNSDQLAYIAYDLLPSNDFPSGKYMEGVSVWLYNPESRAKTEIAACDDGYYGIYWSEFEDKLYITCAYHGPDKFYNSTTGEVAESWGWFLKVSPDGKYGFRDTIDDEAYLFDLESRKKIKLDPDEDWGYGTGDIYAQLLEWGKLDGKTIAYVRFMDLEYVDCATGRMYKVTPPSPDIDPINDLVGFRDGRPVWARITGDKAELFYYQQN